MKALIAEIREIAARDGPEVAWRALSAHRNALTHEADVAVAWVWMLSTHPRADPTPDLVTILEAWSGVAALDNAACDELLRAVEGRHGDDPVGDDDPAQLARRFARRGLDALSPGERADADVAGYLWNTYGNACRLAGPSYDDAAEEAYRNALALRDDPWWRFNVGLLCKNRSRWREGLEVFRRIHRDVGDDGAVLWNLGICATGAGDGRTAVEAWRALGFDAALGDDGLPTMPGIAPVKVRLSRAQRDGVFEHVWAKPVSPCHGTVLSPTIHDDVADFSDLVFWDGQPIGFVEHEGRRVARFAGLGRLRRGGARTFVFAALRTHAQHLDGVAKALGGGASLYVFEDEVEWLCGECIRDGGPHRAAHEAAPLRRGSRPELVRGKLVVPAGLDAADVAAGLDRALAPATSPWLAVPALYRAIGADARWRIHLTWLDALERMDAG